ncbi:ABC transporter permease [Bacillus canaveralius]|uniref:ABC transporter permease n=1 Tax=Bacillus canaveralius TaxID=1403243 RepID=UPI000F767C52|nr:ABC transporter permease [Bacillus canaveralius]RSK56025.1 ABC transporter permease [Bacillus canaveralius]
MKHLLLRQLQHQKGSSLLYILAFILIFVITPLAMVFLQSSQQQVESDISFYGRGSYDLLVRPLGIESKLEKKRGIVPENYIGFGEGGISIDQWKEIKGRPDIEIAAPVASLGYSTGLKSNIGFPLPDKSTRYIAQFQTSDGVKSYPVSEKYVCTMLETAGTIPLPFKMFYKKFESVQSYSLTNYCDGEAIQFPLPATYHLLVGIDPAEEENLTGIVFDGIEEDNPKTGFAAMNQSAFKDSKLIPVLESKEGTVSLELNAAIDQLDIGPEDTKVYRDRLGLVDKYREGYEQRFLFDNLSGTKEYSELLAELTELPAVASKNFTVDMGPRLNPFNQNEAIMVDEQGKMSTLIAGDGYAQDIDLTYSSQYYRAGQPKYEEENGKLVIKKLGEENGLPVYREVQKVGLTLEEAAAQNQPVWIIDPIGEFDTGDRKEILAASPLGIYKQAPVTFKDDKGKIKTVKATTIPGSFVAPAASGVTNIASAALIKGEKPIDAIRVKVAGIDGYTKEATAKIEKIASEIEAMGLQVSIVAGASPQRLDVEVEGLGKVTESWTTLGASGSIVSQWNITNIILAIAFSLVAITYVYNRVIFWQVTKENELRTLVFLGWNKKFIKKLLRSEMILLTVIAWAVSLAGIIGFQILQDIPVSIYIWHVGMMLVALLFLWFIVGINVNGLSKNKKLNRKKNHFRSRFLVLKNISFYFNFIRSPFTQLIFVSGLSSYVYLSLTETVQQTNITILGEYVNLQSSSWHFLLIISAYLLAVFTLGESLSSLFTARQQEIGIFRSIGWKTRHIFSLYIREIALWSACSIFIGNLLCVFLFTTLFDMNSSMWFVTLVSALCFFILVLLAASINIVILLKKNLGDTLQLRRKRAFEKGASLPANMTK